MPKIMCELEKFSDELDLDKYVADQVLSDKETVAALKLLISKGYSADDVITALKAIK